MNLNSLILFFFKLKKKLFFWERFKKKKKKMNCIDRNNCKKNKINDKCLANETSETYLQLSNVPLPGASLLSSSLIGLKQQLIFLLILFLISKGKYPSTMTSSPFNIPLLLQSQLSQYVNFTFGKNNTSVIPIGLVISSVITGNKIFNTNVGQDFIKFLCACSCSS